MREGHPILAALADPPHVFFCLPEFFYAALGVFGFSSAFQQMMLGVGGGVAVYILGVVVRLRDKHAGSLLIHRLLKKSTRHVFSGKRGNQYFS